VHATVKLRLVLPLVALALISSADAQAISPALRRYVVRAVVPEYPAAARDRSVEGQCVVFGNVDFATARLTAVRIERSTGHKILDQAALHAVRQWRFKPRLLRQFRVPIRFELQE
jgi:TonB family protein